jgi:hypothetical protein
VSGHENDIQVDGFLILRQISELNSTLNSRIATSKGHERAQKTPTSERSDRRVVCDVSNLTCRGLRLRLSGRESSNRRRPISAPKSSIFTDLPQIPKKFDGSIINLMMVVYSASIERVQNTSPFLEIVTSLLLQQLRYRVETIRLRFVKRCGRCIEWSAKLSPLEDR